MVNAGFTRSFWHDERGTSFVEAMISLPIVLIVLTAMVEGGIAVYQWNQATKAAQIGARLAAVSSPVVSTASYAALSANPTNIPEGDPVPGNIVTVSCGPGSAACEPAEISRLLTGGDGVCGPTGQAGQIVGMCDIATFIGVDNVHVSYRRNGLGYTGRPFGPVSTITVELRNLTFDFLVFDALIPGLGNINIPAQPVSITSEDVNSCRDTCP